MTAPSAAKAVPVLWRIHDILVGFLSGFGVGTVAGLFVNRLFEDNVVVLISAAIGAVAGIYVLIQNHRDSPRFLNAVVIVTWVLLVLSAAFLTLLVVAIANFE